MKRNLISFTLAAVHTVTASIVILCGITQPTSAEIPKLLNYQGRLTNLSDEPVPDGDYNMIFSLFNAESEGIIEWSEKWDTGTTPVHLSGGLFSVLLGTHRPLAIPFDKQYWLEVEVEYDSGYEILLPRQQLASSPYAFKSDSVTDGAITTLSLASDSVTTDKIDDETITDLDIAPSGISADKITSGLLDNLRINWAAPGIIGQNTATDGYFSKIYASGNVGIGITNPSARLEIRQYNGNNDTPNALHVIGNDLNSALLVTTIGNNPALLEIRDNIGEPALYVKSTGGNIGIGTTTPVQKLDVVGQIRSHAAILHNSSTNSLAIRDIGSDVFRIGVDGTGGEIRVEPVAGSVNAITVIPSGYVGIGTTSPEVKLHVKGTIRVDSSGKIDCANGNLKLDANGTADILFMQNGVIKAGIFDGNVGIGTTNPERPLHIFGGSLTIEESHPNIRLYSDAGNTSWYVGHWYGANNNDLTISNDASEKLRITRTGRIGIGTTNPDFLLHVSQSRIGAAYVNFENIAASSDSAAIITSGASGSSAIRYDESNGPTWTVGRSQAFGDAFVWNTSSDVDDTVGSNPKMVITRSGDVGIGITNPQHKLEVIGKVQATRFNATDTYECNNADLAERLPVHPEYKLSRREMEVAVKELDVANGERESILAHEGISKIEPGMVVVITNEGVVPCFEENDARLAGIISTEPAVKMGNLGKGQYVALAGKVPCKVVGPVVAGDILTTATVEGHACTAEPVVIRGKELYGAGIVGKALEDFEGECGVIDVWIGSL